MQRYDRTMRTIARLILAGLVSLPPAVVAGGVLAILLARSAQSNSRPFCTAACGGNGAFGVGVAATFILLALLLWLVFACVGYWLVARYQRAMRNWERP